MPPKRQVQAFNVVFEQSDATHRCESIAKGGRAAGRLYAFAGLLVLDTKAAERVLASLATDTHSILVIDSDTSYEKPVSELATIVERREMGQWFRSVEDQANDYYRQRER